MKHKSKPLTTIVNSKITTNRDGEGDIRFDLAIVENITGGFNNNSDPDGWPVRFVYRNREMSSETITGGNNNSDPSAATSLPLLLTTRVWASRLIATRASRIPCDDVFQ
ncbi:hypothetical protein CMV_030043 [Castanea mollissima]|uniref:Uncharacterized protein n=1 Tax=Castanea mollissima TaxID=60419 RepID=A0A8J4Q5N5_9ROSI|nr:hypothetical protein CMV_030043 [Castanea mollissima]